MRHVTRITIKHNNTVNNLLNHKQSKLKTKKDFKNYDYEIVNKEIEKHGINIITEIEYLRGNFYKTYWSGLMWMSDISSKS